jgi:hypothetical protein
MQRKTFAYQFFAYQLGENINVGKNYTTTKQLLFTPNSSYFPKFIVPGKLIVMSLDNFLQLFTVSV